PRAHPATRHRGPNDLPLEPPLGRGRAGLRPGGDRGSWPDREERSHRRRPRRRPTDGRVGEGPQPAGRRADVASGRVPCRPCRPPPRGGRPPGTGRPCHPGSRRPGPLPLGAAPGRDESRGRLLRPDRRRCGGRLVTALIAAEFKRIAARRAVRLCVLVAAVGIVAAGVIAFATSSSVSDATYRQEVRAANARVDAQRAAAEQCIQAHGGVAGRDVSPAVRDKCIPVRFASVHDPRFHRQRLGGILKGTSGVFAILGLALGATLLGAEFASRGMTTLLTYEPRRLRVFAAKVATGMGAMAAFAFVSLVAVALALLPALLLHGAPVHNGDPTWAGVAGTIGRGTALVALTTGIGMAIATLGRTTAAALGTAFAY